MTRIEKLNKLEEILIGYFKEANVTNEEYFKKMKEINEDYNRKVDKMSEVFSRQFMNI